MPGCLGTQIEGNGDLDGGEGVKEGVAAVDKWVC